MRSVVIFILSGHSINFTKEDWEQSNHTNRFKIRTKTTSKTLIPEGDTLGLQETKAKLHVEKGEVLWARNISGRKNIQKEWVQSEDSADTGLVQINDK